MTAERSEVLLGWGARPLTLRAPAGVSLRVLAPPAPRAVDLGDALEDALLHPTGARPLAQVASARTRVVVVVSDESREEPRAELFLAVRRALAAVRDDHLTVAVATGTHGPARLDRLGLPEDLLRRHRVVNHDARDEAAMVEMGRTSRGTRLRVNRCLAEADLVVATGRVKPHHVAGWGGGAKAIFPGLAHREDVQRNRALAADPASLLGAADGNPCREDFEEAARRLGRDTWMLNVVEVRGVVVGAVGGDLVYAHREGVRIARPACEVRAAAADCVVVSAPLPVSSSLRQASKLVAPAGLLLREGGTAIVVAECPDGVGPLAVDEEVLARARRCLPESCELVVVSGLDEAMVRSAGAIFAPTVEAALGRARERSGKGVLDVLVLPDAADLVPRRAG